MSNLSKQKREVISAIQKLVKNSSELTTEEEYFQNLLEFSSIIPLSNLEVWEGLLRWELKGTSYDSSSNIWDWWPQIGKEQRWLELCSGNGYKREEALNLLDGGAPSSFLFALLIRRLNDWVPEIRNTAREVVPRCAKKTNPAYIIDVLCLIFPNWNSWGRITDLERQTIFDLLSIKEVYPSGKHA